MKFKQKAEEKEISILKIYSKTMKINIKLLIIKGKVCQDHRILEDGINKPT